MKKKIIIGLSVIGVVAIAAVLYVYMTFFNGTDFSKNVPKNAVFVMKVDLMGMGKKINLKEASESKLFRKEIMENLKSSQKDMMEKVMSNPLKSGLQIASDPTLFLFNNSKSEDEPVLGFMFGIADQKNFNDFLSEIAKDATIKDPDQDGFYKANFNKNEGFVLYFNNKVGIMLLDVERKDISLKRVRDNIVGLEKDNSILSNDDYSSFNKQTNDVMFYLNSKALVDYLEITKMVTADQLKKSINAYPYAMALNFNEDAISLKMFGSKNNNDGPAAIYKEGGFTESELKNIDPKGSPLAYLTMNIDVKKILTLIDEQASIFQSNSGIMSGIENFATQLNVSKDNLLNMFDGKMSMSFSGMRPANFSDSLFVYQPALPFINGWAHLGNKDVATKMLDLMVTQGSLVNNNGIYAENTGLSAPSFFVAIKGNDLFYSTQEDNLKSKIAGGDWNTLKEDYGKKEVMAKSSSIYADLRYSSYESMLKSNMNETNLANLEKFKNILSAFKSVSITGGSNEFEMVVQFTEKKTNSLQRIIELFQEAYRLAS